MRAERSSATTTQSCCTSSSPSESDDGALAVAAVSKEVLCSVCGEIQRGLATLAGARRVAQMIRLSHNGCDARRGDSHREVVVVVVVVHVRSARCLLETRSAPARYAARYAHTQTKVKKHGPKAKSENKVRKQSPNRCARKAEIAAVFRTLLRPFRRSARPKTRRTKSETRVRKRGSETLY